MAGICGNELSQWNEKHGEIDSVPEHMQSWKEDSIVNTDYKSSSSTNPPFASTGHAKRSFEQLNELRKQNMLCDVVLIANDCEVPAHKNVLAACTHYFYAMFTGDLVEAKASRINIQNIDGKALSMLVEFMYTSEIQVTEDNIQVLLSAASLLQLTEVQDACCDFLRSQLHPSNCLGIQSFADLHSCSDLLAAARTYALQYFAEVVQYDEFLNLPFIQLKELIRCDDLTVTSEEQVFESVILWINHDVLSRQCYAARLLESVRLPLLSNTYLITRVDVEISKKNSECKDLFIEALKFHLLSKEEQVQFHSPRTKMRTPIGLPKILLVLGGQAPKAIKTVESYDFKEEKWLPLNDMLSRRCRCGVTIHNGLVYAIGGFNGSLRVRAVDVYDPVTDTWSSVAHMDARRSTLGVAVLNDLIYAVGGFDGSCGLNSVECFDVLTNEWHCVSPMSTRRSSVGVAVVGNHLYAVGGYDGQSRHCLSTVERYQSDTDTWSPVADMCVRRSGAAVGILDKYLYAIGGHDGPLVRKSVEVYNTNTNAWTTVADMHMCRRNSGVVAYQGKLYVIGGDDGSSNLDSIECYNPKTDSWTVLQPKLSIGRSYCGVAVIDKLR